MPNNSYRNDLVTLSSLSLPRAWLAMITHWLFAYAKNISLYLGLFIFATWSIGYLMLPNNLIGVLAPNFEGKDELASGWAHGGAE